MPNLNVECTLHLNELFYVPAYNEFFSARWKFTLDKRREFVSIRNAASSVVGWMTTERVREKPAREPKGDQAERCNRNSLF
jgi:hypothetical protein